MTIDITFVGVGNSSAGQAARILRKRYADITMLGLRGVTELLQALGEKGLRAKGEFVGEWEVTVTTDIEEALMGADLVIWTVPVDAQKPVIRRVLDCNLSLAGQKWMSIHAVGFSMVVLKMLLDKYGQLSTTNTPELLIDVNTSLDAARVTRTGPDAGTVNIVEPKSQLKVCASKVVNGKLRTCGPQSEINAGTFSKMKYTPTPLSKDDLDLINNVLPVLDKLIWIENPLKAAMLTSAELLHVIPTMFNLSALSTEKFKEIADYYPDFVGNEWTQILQFALDAERMGVNDDLGYKVNTLLKGVNSDRGKTYTSMVEYGKDRPMGPEFLPAIDGNYTVQELATSFTLKISVGEILGHPMPLYRAMVTIGNALFKNKLTGTGDFLTEGRNGRDIGIAGMTREQLLEDYGLN